MQDKLVTETPATPVIPVPTPKPYMGRRGILGKLMSMVSLGGMMKDTFVPPGVRAPEAPNKLHRDSGAVRRLKAYKKTRREMQNVSRKANRGTKGHTKLKGQQ